MPAKKRALGSDLKKIDRHVVQPHEYDEIPELTKEWFASADHRRGGKLVRRGRPKSDDPKQLVSLRLDADDARKRLATDENVALISGQAQEASDKGISGVPTFVFAQKYAVSGAQPADQLARAIRQVSAEINAQAAE